VVYFGTSDTVVYFGTSDTVVYFETSDTVVYFLKCLFDDSLECTSRSQF
jgi:hypothetical protein